MFDCVAMFVGRQKHQSVFARGKVFSINFFNPGPKKIGCVCARLFQGLQRVTIDSVPIIHGWLVHRSVGGYLSRPETVSNRLCYTFFIIIIMTLQKWVPGIWVSTTTETNMTSKMGMSGISVSKSMNGTGENLNLYL